MPPQKFKSKSTNYDMALIIEIAKRGEKIAVGQKVYKSSGSCSNRSAMTRVASSMSYLAASANPSTGPCTAGYKKMLGSQLR
jgi:hypothetical protein